MLPTRRLSMHLGEGGLVFFFWVLGEVMVGRGASFVFLCFHQAPGVPQDVPNSTSILSNIFWPQSNFNAYKV
jgi:hypothetical protein